jgi:RNA-directed DNA polymerase
VLEKSDCAVVPVNLPNKVGRPSKEAGEGRAQTRENIVQSHMHPTQSGKRMSQGLDGVRKAARERKQERFTALLHHLSVELLRDSFYALQRKASPGVDGVTWQEYESGLADRLVDLHVRVHRGAYRAKPSRRVFIPKAEGDLGADSTRPSTRWTAPPRPLQVPKGVNTDPQPDHAPEWKTRTAGSP